MYHKKCLINPEMNLTEFLPNFKPICTQFVPNLYAVWTQFEPNLTLIKINKKIEFGHLRLFCIDHWALHMGTLVSGLLSSRTTGRRLGPWLLGPRLLGPGITGLMDYWARVYWAPNNWAHDFFPNSLFPMVQQGVKNDFFFPNYVAVHDIFVIG